jgi:hypothetical protein
MRSVALVLDTDFDEDLTVLARSMPVWIISSPHNDLRVQRIWEDVGDDVSVTSLCVIPGEEPRATLERALYDIDEHHGECSSSMPYEEIVVIGAGALAPCGDTLAELDLERLGRAQGPLRLIKRRDKAQAENIAAGDLSPFHQR